MLRAEKPEIAVDLYREAGNLEDALRVAKEYAPSMVEEIQRQYVESGSSAGPQAPSHSEPPTSSSLDYKVLQERALKWEKEGEYVQAISCYLKITPDMTSDRRILEKAWIRAFELSSKFLPQKIKKISEVVSEKLQGIDRHTSAARIYLELENTKMAIECLIGKVDDL